ncbi:MAG: hypothetical protein OXR66_00935 [Candidatus Woesearchaeota archaeon]|nr:hypothetical protein [Candidatus Woesearchaeota archaeon]
MVDPLKDPLGTVEHFTSDVVKRLTSLHFPTKASEKPLKRSMTGYETETFVLNEQGKVDHSGKLLALAKKAKIHAAPEAAKGMIEVMCLPYKRLRSTSLEITNNLIKLTKLAKKNNYHIYPFATYPGKQTVQITNKPWYKLQANILGEENYKSSGLCCGYHQHYSLPRGLFDQKNKTLKYTTSSKVKRTLLDSWNFLTAADPALTCFLQSSPFVQGKYIAKDSRLLMYRGGGAVQYHKGKYGKRPDLAAGLGPYERTIKDLLWRLDQRRLKWKAAMEAAKINPTPYTNPRDTLKFTWNPLKINPLGTLEYRGCDMNFMTNILAVSTMIKFCLRKIQQDYTLVLSSDIDIKDAFKIEGNFLFVPPHTTVREEMQPASAHEGFKNKQLRQYMHRLYKFARAEVKEFDSDYLPLLKPIGKILDEEETVADHIINDVKKKGYTTTISQGAAQELSLKYAALFEQDLEKAKHELEKYI